MTKPTLNFSTLARRKSQQNLLILLGILSLILVFFISDYWSTIQQINQQRDQHVDTVTTPVRATPTREQQQQIAMVRKLVSELNVPWHEMLNAFESIKENNPDVYLTRIEPNLSKAEIQISGQVSAIGDALKFVDALNQQPQFRQAVLLSQQLKEEDGQLVFTLKVGWLTHG